MVPLSLPLDERSGMSFFQSETVVVSTPFNSKPKSSQSCLTTDSRPVHLGVRPPSGNRDQFSFTSLETVLTFTDLSILCTLSDERVGLWFMVAAGSHQHSLSSVRVPQDSWPYFAVSTWGSPNLQGQVSVFITPGTRYPNSNYRHWNCLNNLKVILWCL
jgi:hypothetical protein